MSQTECKLNLLDLYFSKFSFWQLHSISDTEYHFSFQIEYSENANDTSKIKVVIDTNASSEDDNIVLHLQTVGIFELAKENIDHEVYDQVIKNNTVEIMFPYIRNQLSLLTTQPGIKPVMIPPINIAALIDDASEK